MIKNILAKSTKAVSDASAQINQNAVLDTIKNAKKDTNTIIDKYWPIMEEILLQQLLLVAEKGLNNDEALERAFVMAYEVIPTPVRLIVPRETFIQFCMTRKEPILKKLQKYKNSDEQLMTEEENIISPEPATEGLYNTLLPELLALCIVADGLVEGSEVQLASDIIINDLIIEDKEKALNDLSAHIGSLMIHRSSSEAIYKLKSMDIFLKISKINNDAEKERINIILEGMIEVANKDLISQTKEVTDNMLKHIQ